MRRGRAFALLGISGIIGLQAARGAESAPGIEEDSGTKPAAVVEDRLTVTGTRLRDEPVQATRVPAHVTVIDAERIERAGVQTLQDLLILEAGIVVYDQTGNDVSKSLDLRGFTGGTGTRVFLDGVPLNSSRNNALALELVPLTSLDRVEITRGSAAARAGGGSEAGIINLWSRGGEALRGSLSAAAGDFGSREVKADIQHATGRFDFSLAGSRYETDGFRANAGGDLGRFAAQAGYDLGGGRRLSLSLIDGSSDFGTPGALTASELEDDPGQAPFNLLDFADDGQTQGTLAFQGRVGGPFSLAANLFFRDRGSEILSTGRAAALFGGFFLDSAETVVGSTVQLGHRLADGGRVNELHLGFEWLEGATDAAGFFTSPDDPGVWDPASPSSVNRVGRTTTAAFVRDSFSPSRQWTVTAGLRYDDDQVEYREALPNTVINDSRSYSELSLSAGVTWTPRDNHALRLSYGEAFLPPTAEQLFSFPLFGSNPDLEPEDSSSWEIGYRWSRRQTMNAELALFQIDTRDEIVFDPDSSMGLFGANVNAGETRRRGVEASVRGPVSQVLELFANLTLMDTEFLAGENRGKRVPLVPDQHLALGFLLDLPAELSLRAEALYVGDQVLDNDEPNAQALLDPYTVVNARMSWRPDALLSAVAGEARGLELFVEARNLFDESYATRGIFAFDFSTFSDEIFLTPAPGRRWMGGALWRF